MHLTESSPGPAPEPVQIAAHGPFPAGLRAVVVKVFGVDWEVITHPQVKQVSIRHLGDSDALNDAFQLPEEDIALLVTEKGALLHPKKAAALRDGLWLDDCAPGTYLTAVDSGSLDKALEGSPDTYLLRYEDLIRHLIAGAQQVKAAQEKARADEAQTQTSPSTDASATGGA